MVEATILIIILLATVTFSFGLTFGLFLLYLTLKIKSEFRETLRYEIDKHRKMYEFIRERGRADIGELIEKLEGISPEDVRFPAAYVRWQRFLLKRIDELRTLVGIKNEVFLSDEVKRFFVYDDPSLGDLLNYVFSTYIKREQQPGVAR